MSEVISGENASTTKLNKSKKDKLPNEKLTVLEQLIRQKNELESSRNNTSSNN